MNVLVPAGWQPEEALPENAGLAELSAMLEGEMTTWEDNFREAAEAKGRAQGLTQGLSEGRAQGLTQGLSEGRAQGLTQGLSEGLTKGLAQGRTELLVKMARHKFGEVSAAEVATLLKTVQSGEALDAAGELLLTCRSGEELLSRIREI